MATSTHLLSPETFTDSTRLPGSLWCRGLPASDAFTRRLEWHVQALHAFGIPCIGRIMHVPAAHRLRACGTHPVQMVAVMEEQPAAYHRPQATNCAPAPGMVAERVYDIETANHEYICTIWGGSPSLQGRNGVPSLAKALAGTQDAWKDQAQDDAMNHVAQVLSFDDDAAPQVTDQAPAALSLLNSSSLAAFVAALQGSRIWGNLEGPRIQRAMHKLGVLCAGAMQPGLAPVTICFFQKQPGSFEDLIVKLVDVVSAELAAGRFDCLAWLVDVSFVLHSPRPC